MGSICVILNSLLPCGVNKGYEKRNHLTSKCESNFFGSYHCPEKPDGDW